ncbi:MAG: transaldolase, partial [Candidatus Omnitrophota bacterium]
MNPSTIAIPTLELATAGQSPWLDQISRRLIESGRLRELIEDYGLLGVTSNPSIFEKAIGAKDGGYEPDIRRMARAGKSPFEIYDALTVAEIRSACDLFAKVYQSSGGEHGFVSLEVMPSLSRDTAGTVREALRLAAAVGLPNVMIKVPATPEGVAAVRELIARGVHVNATLIFSAKQYLAVAKAYLDGLAAFAKKGGKPGKVRSVASAFVSRFDSLIDKKLDAMVAPAMDDRSRERIAGLAGKAAIANSKILFQEFKKIFHSEPFLSLAEKGAHPQKLLWGSTSTKNPAYPDLLYVEPLVGLGTVNTIPLETLEAFIDHGHVHAGSVEENVEEAYETAGCLKALGIDLAQTGELLQQQGVRAFSDSFDQLMKTIEVAREAALNTKGGRRKAVTVSVSHGAQRRASSVDAAARKMTKSGFLARFLAKEPALWKKDPEHQAVIRNRMGWLGVADWMRGQCYLLDLLKKDVLQGKIRDVVLFGMGGSSLAPEVMSLICRPAKKGVRFHLLDTT